MPRNDPPILLCYGIGNCDRGDDAQGPLLVEWLEQQNVDQWQLVLEQPYQLQPENLYEFIGKHAILFVDADARLQSGIAFQPIIPRQSHSAFISHAVAPEHLLDLYQRTVKQTPPPAWLLSLSTHGVELGDSVSRQAERNLARARQLLSTLLSSDIEQWRQWQTNVE